MFENLFFQSMIYLNWVASLVTDPFCANSISLQNIFLCPGKNKLQRESLNTVYTSPEYTLTKEFEPYKCFTYFKILEYYLFMVNPDQILVLNKHRIIGFSPKMVFFTIVLVLRNTGKICF